MNKDIVVIPTMTIYGSYDEYKEAMSVFVSEHIDIVRVNMTRFEPKRYISEIALMKKAYQEINPQLKLKILLDIPVPGRKPRVYFDGEQSRIFISKGSTIYLTSNKNLVDVEKNIFVVDDSEFLPYLDINKSKYIFFDDGKLKCRIAKINDTCVEAIALNNGTISFYKSVYTDGYYFTHTAKKDFENILNAINAIKPEYLALSFVEQADEVKKISKCLTYPTKLVPKIETPKGVDNIESIMEVSDAIMIGRGDLAITSGIAHFGKMHAKLLKYSNCIDLFVATDILQSIVEREFPNRADLIDLTHLLDCNVRGLVTSGKVARSSNIGKFKSIVNEIRGEVDEKKHFDIKRNIAR